MFFASLDAPEESVPVMIGYAALGKLAADCVGGLSAEVVSRGMESLAIQMLERICYILEDRSLDDSSCLQRIEDIMSEYYRAIQLRSTRHQELD